MALPVGPATAPGADSATQVFEIEIPRVPGAWLGVNAILVPTPQGGGLRIEDIRKGGVVDMWNRKNPESRQLWAGDMVIAVNDIEGDVQRIAEEIRSGESMRIVVQRTLQHSDRWHRDRNNNAVEPPVIPPTSFNREGWGEPSRPSIMDGSMGSSSAGQKNTTALAKAPKNQPAIHGTDYQQRMGGGGPDVAERHFTFEVQLHKPEGAKLGIDVLQATSPDILGLSVRRIAIGGVVDAWNSRARETQDVRTGDRIICVNGCAGDIARMMDELRTSDFLHLTLIRPSRAPGAAAAGPAAADQASRDAARASAQRSSRSDLPIVLSDDASLHQVFGSRRGPQTAPAIDHEETNPPEAAFRFEVVLDPAPGMRVGVDMILVADANQSGFVIERVTEDGRVHLWNRKSQAPFKVRTGDYIKEVNGIKVFEHFEKMAAEFRKDNEILRFVVQRNPPQPGKKTGVQPGALPTGMLPLSASSNSQAKAKAKKAPQAPPPPPIVLQANKRHLEDRQQSTSVAPSMPPAPLSWGLNNTKAPAKATNVNVLPKNAAQSSAKAAPNNSASARAAEIAAIAKGGAPPPKKGTGGLSSMVSDFGIPQPPPLPRQEDPQSTGGNNVNRPKGAPTPSGAEAAAVPTPKLRGAGRGGRQATSAGGDAEAQASFVADGPKVDRDRSTSSNVNPIGTGRGSFMQGMWPVPPPPPPPPGLELPPGLQHPGNGSNLLFQEELVRKVLELGDQDLTRLLAMALGRRDVMRIELKNKLMPAAPAVKDNAYAFQ